MKATAAAVLLSLLACARNEPAERSTLSTASEAVIALERTACYGRCPVYTISVSPSGEVLYEGRAHVRKVGTATSKVPVQQVDALLSELEQGGYLTFAERYTSSEPACGRYATDSPTTITSVTLQGRTKQITHDYGCGAAPGALTVLERRIDEALNSAQWTGR